MAISVNLNEAPQIAPANLRNRAFPNNANDVTANFELLSCELKSIVMRRYSLSRTLSALLVAIRLHLL